MSLTSPADHLTREGLKGRSLTQGGGVNAVLSRLLRDLLPNDLQRGRVGRCYLFYPHGNIWGSAGDPSPSRRYSRLETFLRTQVIHDSWLLSFRFEVWKSISAPEQVFVFVEGSLGDPLELLAAVPSSVRM